MSSQETKSILRKMDFPLCAQEALIRIESLISKPHKQDFIIEIIAEFVFKDKNRSAQQLSIIQEFQLVVVMCEFFSVKSESKSNTSEASKNAIFLHLFGSIISQIRISVLLKLISTAISASIPQVLLSGGIWIQQVGATSGASLELAQSLVKDFIVYSNKSSLQLKKLPEISPAFAASFITSVTELYLNESKGAIVTPPDNLLQLITDWISTNPSLLFATQNNSLFLPNAIVMPSISPVAGLIRWCVVSALFQFGSSYSKLHLVVLQSLMEAKSNAVNSQHFGQIISSIQNKADLQKLNKNNPENDDDIQLAMERFGQMIQVCISTKCIYGNIPQLLFKLESLPKNQLMEIIISSNK